MGEVYLGEDTILDRKVAIKFLPAESSNNATANLRLIREAKAAATLDHPNICAIHEVNTEKTRHFIVMQYVEGETLDCKIKTQSLDVSQALTFAVQIADAIAEAHTRGIIHRDIKPQNIIITPRGQAKVMDFGLAKDVRATEPFDTEAKTLDVLTTPGMILGTVPYMSPEQVRGEAVDARTDIFSFGTLLYEMISGRNPFRAGDPASTISAILTDEPQRLARYSPSVSNELDHVVRKCLEKNRDRRYQSMGDLVIDLDNLRRGDSKAALKATHPEIQSLAVLPMANLSGDPGQEYFADGMTETLIAGLAKVSTLRVISRTSVMRYKNSSKPLPEIAHELHVDAIIEGSVQRLGERVQITVQLIEGSTDQHLWSETYARDLRDILSLQNEVARAVTQQIQMTLSPQDQIRLTRVRPINPAAYDHFLHGRFRLNRQTKTDNESAIEMLRHAVTADPTFAAAWAALAQACIWKLFLFSPGEKVLEEEAFVAVEKALSLDPDLAEAYLARGRLLWTPSNHFPHDKAIQQYRRALALNPNLDEAQNQLALVYAHVGLFEEALQQLERAVATNPSNTLVRFHIGETLFFQGKYERALNALRSVPRDVNPALVGFQMPLVLMHLGRTNEAAAVLDESFRDCPEDNGGLFRSVQALIAALAGKRDLAENKISEAIEKGKGFGHFHHTAYNIACAYSLMNKPDLAIKLLESAAHEGFPCYPLFDTDPYLDSLRHDSRFVSLLMQLKEQWEYYRSLTS